MESMCPSAAVGCTTCLVVFIRKASWEKYENKFDQHDVGHKHKQRRQDHRTGGCAADARRASLGPHALKTRDQSDDQSEDGGLECRRQKIVEISALETGIDELMQRERLRQRLRYPTHEHAAGIASQREQRQHQ